MLTIGVSVSRDNTFRALSRLKSNSVHSDIKVSYLVANDRNVSMYTIAHMAYAIHP